MALTKQKITALNGMDLKQQVVQPSKLIPVDAWYGPWESLESLNNYIEENINLGLKSTIGVITVGIWDEEQNTVSEYWNPDASINFVQKMSSVDVDALTGELDKRYVRVEELGESSEDEESTLATKDYVDAKVAELVNGAPEALDTLKEIGDALRAHEGTADAILSTVAQKANKLDVEEALQNVVSKDELNELIGTPREAAVGTEGEEGYKPVVPATGLHADIEEVAYRRFMQLIGLVGAADEEVMKNVKDVEHNLHGNIKEVQANLYGNIRGVRNEISDMIRKYLNQEGSDYVLAHDAYELQNMISADDDKKVVVMKDTVLSKTISVGNGVDKVLDLNGCIISNERLDYTTTEDGHTVTSNVDAITVKTGGKLTLVGNGYVTTVAGTASPLYANGGEIVVNGGVYESLQGLDAGGGYSLVYADKTGKVEINDGYFIVNGNPDEKKYQYILNASDPATEAVITVKGGYFYNWDPSTHDNNGHQEVVIPEDYKVEAIENGTFYQHVGTWYHVVKKQNA